MKRTISLLVVLCLIISIFTIFPTIANAQTSGKCDDNLTWMLENGVLTISGTGHMKNFLGIRAPWLDYSNSIKTIVIENGVKSIGAYAFKGYSTVKDVSISHTVKAIGESAFEGCSGLTQLTIPESVKTIGESAFEGCSGLTQLTIPGSVKTIGKSAFEWCCYLTNLTLSDGIANIGNDAFNSCYDLTTLTIPKSVTYLGDLAFSNCLSLQSVTVPSTLTNLNRAFSSGTMPKLNVYTPDVRTLYSPDGIALNVSPSHVEDYLKAGWYKVPVQTMYSLDGRKIIVEKAQVKDYAKVGWYENLADVQQYIYSPSGKSAVVYKSEVPSYTAVGWSTTPLSFKTNSKLPLTFTYNKNVVTTFTINDFYIRKINYDRGNNKSIVFDIDYTGPSEFPIEFLSYDINGNLLATEEVNLRIFSYVSVPKATASLIIRAKTNDNNPVYCYNEYIKLYSSSGKSINVPYLLQNTYYPEYTPAVIMFDKAGNEVSVEPSKVNDYVNKGYYQDYCEYIYYTNFTPKYQKHMNNKEYDEAYAWALFNRNIFTEYVTVVESLFTESNLYTAKSLWQSNSTCPIGITHHYSSIDTLKNEEVLAVELRAMNLCENKIHNSCDCNDIDYFIVAFDSYINDTFYKTFYCHVEYEQYNTDYWGNNGYWGTNLDKENIWFFHSSKHPDVAKVTKTTNFRISEVKYYNGTKWTPSN